MISISQDVRKVQKSCFSANVNVDGKHLKQIKKKEFNIPFKKRGFGTWPMNNGVKIKNKNCVKEVSEKRMATSFSYSYGRVGGACRLLVPLSPVKVNLVAYLG